MEPGGMGDIPGELGSSRRGARSLGSFSFTSGPRQVLA